MQIEGTTISYKFHYLNIHWHENAESRDESEMSYGMRIHFIQLTINVNL